MPPVEFEPAILASERPQQTYALGRAATWIGHSYTYPADKPATFYIGNMMVIKNSRQPTVKQASDNFVRNFTPQ
jgi:hypothetical protein